jgi:hypothetical protein
LKTIVLTCCLFLAPLLVPAQGYLGYSMEEVKSWLEQYENSFFYWKSAHENCMISMEDGDSSVWKFGPDSLCYEYMLFTGNDQYEDISRRLRRRAIEVDDLVFVNVKEGTITYLYQNPKNLLVITRWYEDEMIKEEETTGPEGSSAEE